MYKDEYRELNTTLINAINDRITLKEYMDLIERNNIFKTCFIRNLKIVLFIKSVDSKTIITTSPLYYYSLKLSYECFNNLRLVNYMRYGNKITLVVQ